MTGTKKTEAAAPLLVLCAIMLALLCLMFYGVHYRAMVFVLCLAAVALCILRRGRLLLSPAAAAMGIFLAVSALSGLSAISGKFFLKEFSKLLMAFCVFLAVISSGDRKRAITRCAFILSIMAAVFAFFSVELGCTACLRPLFNVLTGLTATSTGFEEGTRLTGVFGNPNVLASALAIGILLSIHLISSGESSLAGPCAVALSFSTFCFVLAFSLGATAFFALSCLIYLLLSGKDRGSVLLTMLEFFMPAAVFAFGAFPFFNNGSSPVPVLLMLLAAGFSLLIFRLFHSRLLTFFASSRRSLIILGAALAAAAVYIVSALSISGAYCYDQTGSFSRSLYLAPGEHSVTIACSDVLGLNVYSQTDGEIMTATRSSCLSCWMEDGQTIRFTVPEGSQVQHFVLWAREGSVLESVVVDGSISVKLDHKLLPDFIANRLQGIFKSQNAVQRTVFFKDGLKLFLQSPVLGNGYGSFESAACSVQSYYYETRYVHNHYIQLLTDCGALGLAAYLAVLVLLIVSLVRHPGPQSAALGACLFMIIGHSVMEVSMSMSVYLPFAFGVFAMAGAGDRPCSGAASKVFGWSCGGIYAVFTVLVCLNLWAADMVDRSQYSYSSFMHALSRAASADPFEYNDYKISYVYNSLGSDSGAYDDQARQYAQELSTVRSNSISSILLQYYLEKQMYDSAFDCAIFGAMGNRSDSQTWNDYFDIISNYLPVTVLEASQAERIIELYDAFIEAGSSLMTPVQLSDSNQLYVRAVSALID